MRVRNTEEDDVVMSLGEHGGLGGKKFDDGDFSSIKQVEIAYNWRCINSIVTEYCDHNGNSFWSNKHGGNEYAEVKKVILDHPNEYLFSIHGHMDEHYYGLYLIRSLTLESNKRSYGPFGIEKGKKFWFPTTGAKIVGFYGKAGFYLDSIGIKVVPMHNKTPKPQV